MGKALFRVQSWADAARLGEDWPRSVGIVADGRQRVLCIGPADWLVALPEGAQEAPELPSPDGMPRETWSVVDVSSALEIVEIAGPHARAMLATGCGLDLHPDVFKANDCARTRLAQIAVVLHCREGGEGFDCYVSRSYSAYLRSWLADAAAGFT